MANSWKKILTEANLPNLAKYAKITLAQANTVTLDAGFYNIEAETLIAGYGYYWYLIQLGAYTDGGYRAQLAVPYESGTNKGMFMRTAAGTTWGAWVKLASNDGALQTNLNSDKLKGLIPKSNSPDQIPIANNKQNNYLISGLSESSKKTNYDSVSPFNQVYLTRLNGDNYDNGSENFIKVIAQSNNVVTFQIFPYMVLNLDPTLRYEWGIISLEDFNSSGTNGDYTTLCGITSFNKTNGTATLKTSSMNFLNKKVALICYDLMGNQLNNGNPIVTVSKINDWFGLSLVEGTDYVSTAGSFINGSVLTLLVYFKDGTYWFPHYIDFDSLDFTTPVSYGKCLTGTISDNVLLSGKQFETDLYIYFPCSGSFSGAGNGRCRTMIYNKTAGTYSVNFSLTTGNLIADIPASGWGYMYSNYVGYDGKYYYITALYRNTTVPTITTDIIPEDTPKWILYELRSLSPTSGFTDAIPIVGSYDVWGCEHNYPEASYTFKVKNETYLAVTGTNFVTKSGTRANREWVIFKRDGYGRYKRDRRSPLIMNPMYGTSMGLSNTNATYQFDHIGSGLGFSIFMDTSILFYTASHGQNLYKVFAIEKPELLEINI